MGNYGLRRDLLLFPDGQVCFISNAYEGDVEEANVHARSRVTYSGFLYCSFYVLPLTEMQWSDVARRAWLFGNEYRANDLLALSTYLGRLCQGNRSETAFNLLFEQQWQSFSLKQSLICSDDYHTDPSIVSYLLSHQPIEDQYYRRDIL